jgi:predicted dehydrogenase
MTMHFDRRGFLRASAAGAAFLLVPRSARAADVNGKLRVAAIGTGNKGRSDLAAVAASERVEVSALCNVDASKKHLGWAVEEFPKAEVFRDYRRLLDKPDLFDAVIVATPDHMHAPIALAAMQLGKHVFCEKPLAHTVSEVRAMREAAERHRVVTQMGNQIQSRAVYRNAVKLVHDGAIGKVREVHSWQSSMQKWVLPDSQAAASDPVPKRLEWDLWLGVAAARPYRKELYHPKNWRVWQDFGTGQLGDFGCHILDPVFQALELSPPISVEADNPPLDNHFWPFRCRVQFRFPGTDRTTADELSLTWYDGKDHTPELDGLGLPDDYKWPEAGSVLVGEAGSLVIPHVAEASLFPKEKFKEYELPKLEDLNHYTSWADACLDGGKTTSNFNYAAPLTETVLLGTIALRFPKEQLLWDAKAGQFTHHADANARLSKEYRAGWAPA